MNLPALPFEAEETSDELQQQFYCAAMANSSSGSQELDLLLKKGLYGKRAPKSLTNKRAADAFQSAFDLIGGVPRLALWADKNPTAFFSLYSKLIPATVHAQVNATIEIKAPWMSPNRLAYQNQTTEPQMVVDVTPNRPQDLSAAP